MVLSVYNDNDDEEDEDDDDDDGGGDDDDADDDECACTALNGIELGSCCYNSLRNRLCSKFLAG